MPKTPQDHKSKTFDYTFDDGRKVTLPRFADVMTFGRVRRLRHLPESEQFFCAVEEVCDDATLAALDQMTAAETEAFMAAWQEDSGANLGESSGSST